MDIKLLDFQIKDGYGEDFVISMYGLDKKEIHIAYK